MKIQTTQMLGDDGKIMTSDQVEISSLKKDGTALQKENSKLKEAIEALEARVASLESASEKQKRDATQYPIT